MAIVQSLTVLSYNYGCRGTPGGGNVGQAQVMQENEGRQFCLLVGRNWFVFHGPVNTGFRVQFNALDMEDGTDVDPLYNLKPTVYIDMGGGNLVDKTDHFSNDSGLWRSSTTFVTPTGLVYILYRLETYPRVPLWLKVNHSVES